MKTKLSTIIVSVAVLASTFIFIGCAGKKTSSASAPADTIVEGPAFNADSAYAYTAAQCEFGPRTMNSRAHDLCGDYIVQKFRQFGCEVVEQKADLKGYDGTTLHSRNIIASLNPDAGARIMVCAHWDSRPWADNDPNPANHHTPVLAANDGASGVAVMLEMARIMGADKNLAIGVDFICFDAEDYGTPQWAEQTEDSSDTWALGAQYWSTHLHTEGYRARYGILLDMVGGRGSQFYYEGFSLKYAQNIVRKVWNIAGKSGFESFFPKADGGYITDDHDPVNKNAGFPCIDIINYAPDCAQSTFGPTWHTVSDDMEHIDPNVLKAVGQTVVNVIYNEE